MGRIRRASTHDVSGVYRVCLKTGAAGGDATEEHENPDLLGHAYAGAYLAGEPKFALVAVDEHGVGGYAVGAPDTRTFESWLEQHWWPTLREQYPLTPEVENARTPDARLIRRFHRPSATRDGLLEEFPAHLHINLLERCRGGGMGRALIEELTGALRQHGCTGVHLGVAPENQSAIGFYRRLGFETLASRPDELVLGMRFV
ncbi:GNAT family N-acetyltransferase [Microbacterium halotolerans]|uniref:GNAT family N-acetyltransferase n=1 Tax=Microbacterium halotolerans TaxID=246613 RepID=UPI000E6AA69A|nr:N-acetyltransferase [Microbacterium halotolerans]